MRRTILVLFLILIGNATIAQVSVDSLFRDINNKELEVSPVFGGEIIWKQDKSGLNYPVRLDSNKRMFRVATFESDIRELSKEFSEKKISMTLYRLLSDTTKDLFANALLFELLDNRLLGQLMFMNRQDWIASGKKSRDLKFWTAFLKSKGYLDE